MDNRLVLQRKASNPHLYLGMVAVAVLVLVGLADYPVVGHVAIGAYALLAFWRLQSSRVFGLALVALAVVFVATATGWWQVVGAFSGYAFLLFMVGVFVLGRELWRYSQALREQRLKGEDKAI